VVNFLLTPIVIVIFLKIILNILLLSFVYSNEQDGQCLLDIIDYYTHTNRELAAILGRTSQRLHELEIENESRQISQS